jgi:hypothetical protein
MLQFLQHGWGNKDLAEKPREQLVSPTRIK